MRNEIMDRQNKEIESELLLTVGNINTFPSSLQWAISNLIGGDERPNVAQDKFIYRSFKRKTK